MNHIILGQNILVKQKEALTKSIGGIVVPDMSRTKPLEGTIIKLGEAIGETCFTVGDEVLFDRFAGTRIELDNEEFLVMSTEDILIILKGVK